MEKIKPYLEYSQTFTVIGIILMLSCLFEVYDTAIERIFRTPFGLYQSLTLLGIYHIVHGIIYLIEES